MPSPFAHALTPTFAAWFSRAEFPALTRVQWFRLFVATTVLGNIADLDLIPASLFQDQWANFHRAWGHNVFALSLFIWVGQWGLRRFVSSSIPRKTAWIMAFFLVMSHCLLDGMMEVDSRGRLPGIPLFYPFSRMEFSTGLQLFACTPIEPGVNPILGHALSREFWTHVLAREILLSLVLGAIWLVVFSTARAVFELAGLARQKTREPQFLLNDLRRDVPGSSHHTSAGVTAGAAEVKPPNGRPEVSVLR